MSNEKVFLLSWKGGKAFNFCTVPDMSAGWMFMHYHSYISLSGFFYNSSTSGSYNIFPIISVFIVWYCVDVFFLSLFSFNVLYTICLYACIWHNIVVWPFICYVFSCRWQWMFLIWSRMASSGSVFVYLFTWLCRKFSAVLGVGLICCLLCVIILPVLVTFVCSVVMIVTALVYYCPIGPQSPMFLLNCYSWPYGNRHKHFWSIIASVIFPCLCIKVLWCLSSLCILIGSLSITGIMPLTRWLNSSIAGLGRPCPSGVILICSIAMCISPPESEHFL